MYRTFMTLALVAALALGGGAPLAAQPDDSPASSLRRHHPPVPTGENPYAKPLEEARQKAKAAYGNLLALMEREPFNFDAQLAAYYAYIYAQTRVQVLQKLHDEWEQRQKQILFTGRVLVRPRIVRRKPGAFLKGKPIAGATITLTRSFFPRRPFARTKDADQGEDTSASGVSSSRIFKPFTKTTRTNKKGAFVFRDLKPGRYRYEISRKGFGETNGYIVFKEGDRTEKTFYLGALLSLSGTVTTVRGLPRFPFKPQAEAKRKKGKKGKKGKGKKGKDDTDKYGKKRKPVAGAVVELGQRVVAIMDSAGPSQPAQAGEGTALEAPAKGDANALIYPGPRPPDPIVYRDRTNGKGRYNLRNIKPGRYEMTVTKEGLRTFTGWIIVTRPDQEQDVVLFPELPVPAQGAEPPAPPAPLEQEMQDEPQGDDLNNPFGP